MTIEERVKQIIGGVLNISADGIRLDASLKDDLGATSLDRFTVLMDIEEAYSLDFDDVPEDVLEEKIQSVSDVVAFLERRLAAKS